MNYPLNELDSGEFEKVVASICEEILGIATITFSEGKDGGRDAKFTGKANDFPSISSPWDGKFIIQAKHTNKINASCSDSEFTTTLKKEISSIKALKAKGHVDYYLLFTNRKLSGCQDEKIDDFINEELDIPNCILGIERIQKWLKDYPIIAKKHSLNRLLLPLEFYEDDLKILIESFAQTDFDNTTFEDIKRNNERISVEEKNKLNSLSEEYFNNLFKKSMNDFSNIQTFMKDPKNRELQKLYDNTIDDIQSKIIVRRNEFDAFEKIIDYLYDYVFENNKEALKNHRKLIRTFLHYMYFNCDIGISE